ncbi:MAG: hypothetical protein QME74_02895, partial [Candidatus Edwardsbacteria bacterium]|nr:hypothetical protein [Candidatus Edwardsbacteria bacterium]
KESVVSIIESFPVVGYSLAGIERALELPTRTLSRWKSGDFNASAGSLALLRILKTYPWIIDVADVKYNEFDAKSILIREAINVFNNLAQGSGYSPVSMHRFLSNTELSIGVQYMKDVNTISDNSSYTQPGVIQQ